MRSQRCLQEEPALVREEQRHQGAAKQELADKLLGPLDPEIHQSATLKLIQEEDAKRLEAQATGEQSSQSAWLSVALERGCRCLGVKCGCLRACIPSKRQCSAPQDPPCGMSCSHRGDDGEAPACAISPILLHPARWCRCAAGLHIVAVQVHHCWRSQQSGCSTGATVFVLFLGLDSRLAACETRQESKEQADLGGQQWSPCSQVAWPHQWESVHEHSPLAQVGAVLDLLLMAAQVQHKTGQPDWSGYAQACNGWSLRPQAGFCLRAALGAHQHTPTPSV